jgi:hypothetical protein
MCAKRAEAAYTQFQAVVLKSEPRATYQFLMLRRNATIYQGVVRGDAPGAKRIDNAQLIM